MRTVSVLIRRYPRDVNGSGASRPATRLLTMLEVLQARGTASGRELAERLEVDPRTVRRYAVKLEDLGIPVETERGPTAATGCGRASSCRR
jgi:predicted DNA-binding transcriptional regulator YafY